MKNQTYLSAERQLIGNGFICTTLDRNCSVFKNKNIIAYVIYMGFGNGYETTVYDTTTEAQ